MKFDENALYNSNNRLILKIYHTTEEPGKNFLEEEHHTECELSLVVSGSGTYSVCGNKYFFSTGDMFMFSSNEEHCLTEVTSSLNMLIIKFEPFILLENAESTELLKIFYMRNKNFRNHFSGNDTILQNIILDIENEISKKQYGYGIKTKYLLFSSLIHIIRSYDYVNKLNACTYEYEQSKKILEAITYIDNNINNKLTLKEISSFVCMAESYFSAVFKKTNGISPWEYITIKRVEKAVDLIRNTNMTKLEIAEKCGFSSSSNFYKAFSKITGKKPSDYSSKNHR